MERKALRTFYENAVKRNEKPTVENNYFTIKFNEERHPQPSDWVSTCIAKHWCEYHGPGQHTLEKCHVVTGEPRDSHNQKPKIDPKAFAAWRKQVSVRPPVFLSILGTNKSYRSKRISSC